MLSSGSSFIDFHWPMFNFSKLMSWKS